MNSDFVPPSRAAGVRSGRLTEASSTADARVALTGEHGLLTALVTDILQRGLEVELTAHVGHQFRQAGSGSALNSRNGAFAKRLMTDLGMVQLQMPRDRRGTFEPLLVPKHDRRRLASTTDLARLYASGTTRTEMRAQLNQMTHFQLQATTVTALMANLERVVHVWQRRRFERSYPVLLLDTISPGSREPGQFLDVAMAVDIYGVGELLGIWRRKARIRPTDRWAEMFGELRGRGLTDARHIVSTGDADLPLAATQIWPLAEVRSGVEALVRNALR